MCDAPLRRARVKISSSSLSHPRLSTSLLLRKNAGARLPLFLSFFVSQKLSPLYLELSLPSLNEDTCVNISRFLYLLYTSICLLPRMPENARAFGSQI